MIKTLKDYNMKREDIKSKNKKENSPVPETLQPLGVVEAVKAIGMVDPDNPEGDRNMDVSADASLMFQYSQTQEERNNDMLELFPDVEGAYGVVESIVINGKTILDFGHQLPPTVNIALLAKAHDILNEKHKMGKKLPTILEEAYFRKGSTAYLTIPFEVLTTLKRSATVGTGFTTEDALVDSLTEEMNIGGTDEIFSSSNALKKLGIHITSNLDMFRMNQEVTSFRVNAVKPTNESDLGDYNYKDLFDAIDNPDAMPVLTLPISRTVNIKNDGLHTYVDSNAVFPLNLKGEVSNPVGYLLLLDEVGGLLSDIEHSEELLTASQSINDNVVQEKINKRFNDLRTTSSKRRIPKLDHNNVGMYSELLHNEVMSIIGTSKLKDMIKKPKLGHVTKIMFDRALRSLGTNLIYVPEEYITYYHFALRSNGTGKSMLESVERLLEMRARLTLAKVRGEIENSIPITIMDVAIDPDNKKPLAEMERIKAENLKSNNRTMDWKITGVRNISDSINSVGIYYRFSHPSVPRNEYVEQSSTKGQRVDISEEYLKSLKNDVYRKMSLTKDVMDGADGVELATVKLLSNDLTKKEMSRLQTKLMEIHSTHCTKVLRIDGDFIMFLDELIDVHSKNIIKSYGKNFEKRISEADLNEEQLKNVLIRTILDNFEVKLPSLRNEDDDTLSNRFDNYARSLDDVIDAMVASDESIPDEMVSSDLKGLMRLFKGSYKQLLLRKWMLENDYMVEVANIISINDGESNLAHMNDYFGTLSKLMDALKGFNKNLNLTFKESEKVIKGKSVVNTPTTPVTPEGEPEPEVTGDTPTPEEPPVDNTPPDKETEVAVKSLLGEDMSKEINEEK